MVVYNQQNTCHKSSWNLFDLATAISGPSPRQTPLSSTVEAHYHNHSYDIRVHKFVCRSGIRNAPDTPPRQKRGYRNTTPVRPQTPRRIVRGLWASWEEGIPASCVSDLVKRHASSGGIVVGWEVHGDLEVIGFDEVSVTASPLRRCYCIMTCSQASLHHTPGGRFSPAYVRIVSPLPSEGIRRASKKVFAKGCKFQAPVRRPA